MESSTHLTKGQATRSKIIDTTIPLMAKKGFHGTTFQEIADACELSQAAVLRHFPTKSLLFMSVIEQVVHTNHTYVEMAKPRANSGLEPLKVHFRMNTRWASECPEQAMNILLLYYLASFDPEFRTLYKKVLSVGRERVTRHFFEHKMAHRLKLQDTEINRIGETVHEAFLGMLLNLISTGEITSEKATRRGLDKIQKLIFQFFPTA